MAQDVTQAFIDEWAKKGGKVAVSRVRYKRRYHNGSAFVYETNFHTLDQGQYVSTGEIAVQADSRFKNIFKTTADGIMVTDNNGHIVKINAAVANITGYREDELIGKHVRIMPPNDEEHRKRNAYLSKQLFEKG